MFDAGGGRQAVREVPRRARRSASPTTWPSSACCRRCCCTSSSSAGAPAAPRAWRPDAMLLHDAFERTAPGRAGARPRSSDGDERRISLRRPAARDARAGARAAPRRRRAAATGWSLFLDKQHRVRRGRARRAAWPARVVRAGSPADQGRQARLHAGRYAGDRAADARSAGRRCGRRSLPSAAHLATVRVAGARDATAAPRVAPWPADEARRPRSCRRRASTRTWRPSSTPRAPPATPKGVMLTHLNMRQRLALGAGLPRPARDDVIGLALPPAFSYGLYHVLMGLGLGATVVLERLARLPGQGARDPWSANG